MYINAFNKTPMRSLPFVVSGLDLQSLMATIPPLVGGGRAHGSGSQTRVGAGARLPLVHIAVLFVLADCLYPSLQYKLHVVPLAILGLMQLPQSAFAMTGSVHSGSQTNGPACNLPSAPHWTVRFVPSLRWKPGRQSMVHDWPVGVRMPLAGQFPSVPLAGAWTVQLGRTHENDPPPLPNSCPREQLRRASPTGTNPAKHLRGKGGVCVTGVYNYCTEMSVGR